MYYTNLPRYDKKANVSWLNSVLLTIHFQFLGLKSRLRTAKSILVYGLIYVRLWTINLCGFGYSPNAFPNGIKSAFTPSGSRHINLCIREAKIRWSSGFAIDSPRHTRLPAENGSQLSGFGPSFPFSSRNLSGLNSSTSFQTLGSWCSAQWLIITIVFFGIS